MIIIKAGNLGLGPVGNPTWGISAYRIYYYYYSLIPYLRARYVLIYYIMYKQYIIIIMRASGYRVDGRTTTTTRFAGGRGKIK